MQNILFKDKYTLQLDKVWSDKELDIANCIGMIKKENLLFIDTRVTAPASLKDFLILCFPTLMFTSENKFFKERLFGQLNAIYKEIYNDFIQNRYVHNGYEKSLFKHQKKALSLMIHRKYNLLSFTPGGGKTITSATISKLLKLPRTIIVTPASLKWNWFNELTDEWGYDKMLWTILDSKKSKCIFAFNERFVVVNYEAVAKHFNYLTKYNAQHIIIDEVHYVKNTKSQRYKSLNKLLKAFPDARVTMLTGTPATNRVNDMFSYFKMSNHPLGRNYAEFLRNYTISTSSRGQDKVIGVKNMDELKLKISNFMIRVRTEECVDMPELMIKKYFFDMGDIKGEYERYIEELYESKKQLDLAQTTQEKKEIGFKIKGNIHTLNRLLATSKVKSVIPLIDQLIENGRDVIVFSGYRDPLLDLEEHYGDACVKIIGGMDSDKKNNAVKRFTTDPSCKVFLGNFKAAGTGINLVNSQDVIFLNFPFTPDELEQSYKRSFRIGQKNNVRVYYTFVRESIDERTFELVSSKAADIDDLLDGDAKSVVKYGNIQGELFKTLMEQYEEKHNIKKPGSFVSIK